MTESTEICYRIEFRNADFQTAVPQIGYLGGKYKTLEAAIATLIDYPNEEYRIVKQTKTIGNGKCVVELEFVKPDERIATDKELADLIRQTTPSQKFLILSASHHSIFTSNSSYHYPGETILRFR